MAHAAADPYLAEVELRPSAWRSGLRRSGSFARRYPLGAAAALFIVVIVLVAAAPDVFARSNYDAGVQRRALESPSGAHWFGTDHLGRDVYSRVVYGARTSVVIGLATVALATAGAAVLALLAVSLRGWFDVIAQRVVDVWLTFPPIIFTILILSVVGPSTTAVILALAVVSFAAQERIIRSAALAVAAATYIEAAEAIGAGRVRLMLRHVLPNVAPIVIVTASVNVGSIILAESSLSFLGFGPPPPYPSWGRMLNDSQPYLRIASYLALFPALAIVLSVYACNMLGDAIRDALDPRLRGT